MSNGATDMLTNIRRIIRLHETMLKEVCEVYHLTLMEATVISFLHNNPGKDTAADIVELRMLQKSNVSSAVESLYQKRLLVRNQDHADRRKVHLSLTENADGIVCSIDRLWEEFRGEMFEGITEDDMLTFIRINEKIGENVKNAAERREKDGRK